MSISVKKICFGFILFSFINNVFAHSGGTDQYGCHAGSQPYHCHNGGSSGSGHNDENSGFSINQIAKIMTGGLVLFSAFDSFSQPIMISYNSEQSKYGVGASYIDKQIPFYVSSKTFGDFSVINFGRVTNIRSINNIDTLMGIGIYTKCEEHVCLDPDADEQVKFNLNVVFRYRLNNAAFLIDLDSGNRGLSVGLSAGY